MTELKQRPQDQVSEQPTAGAADSASPPDAVPGSPAAGQRYLVLDAMRGLVMLVLVWGCCLSLNATGLRKTPALSSFARQFDHVPWEGFGVWEWIQPSFWFVVGASLPFALARRREQGATFAANLRHASVRALKLILLGQFLVSVGAGQFRLNLMETLTHIGLCYLLCFLILHLRFRWQALTAALLLAVTTGLYLLFPGADGSFSATDNFGRMVDRAVFGAGRSGRTVNFNLFPSTVHMLFGAWAGMLLMSKESHVKKLGILVAAALASLLAGLTLAPHIPIVQRIFTASFAFYSAGYVLAVAAVFFCLFDVMGLRRLALPLVVVGTNSIFMYMLSALLRRWIDQTAGVFTGRFQFLGPPGGIAQACVVTFVMWYVCYWLYQRKIFFKL